MRRSKMLLLGVGVLAGLFVLSVVTFGVISSATADRVTASDGSTTAGSNNTTNTTGRPPPCPGPGPVPPPSNDSAAAPASGNGSGLPPPPPPGCGGPNPPPPPSSGGCANMTAPSNDTGSSSAEDD